MMMLVWDFCVQLLQENSLRPDFDPPECPELIPVTETGLPGLDPKVVLYTNKNSGLRTFTCSSNRPNPYSEYTAKLGDNEGSWWGEMYYDDNGFPTYNLTWQDPWNYDEYGNKKLYPRSIVTFKEFIESESLNGSAPWARYKVLSDTGSPPVAYVERAKTEGGATPPDCNNEASVSVGLEMEIRLYVCETPAVTTTPPPPSDPVAEPPEENTPSPQPVPPNELQTDAPTDQEEDSEEVTATPSSEEEPVPEESISPTTFAPPSLTETPEETDLNSSSHRSSTVSFSAGILCILIVIL